MSAQQTAPITPDSPEAFLNRELSWLNFAERVIALVEDRDLPLVERVKFAGIAGMLHDEFFMKRMSGLKRQMRRRVAKTSLDGLSPEEEFRACREKLLEQVERLGAVIEENNQAAP